MPGPISGSIWLDVLNSGTLIVFENYRGKSKSKNRITRVLKINERVKDDTWKCKWCKAPFPIHRRCDVMFCGKSCRKKYSYAKTKAH